MTAVSLAASSALAALLALGQVPTATVSKWTPEACRNYREASILNKGSAEKCVAMTDQLRGDLVGCEARNTDLEAKALEPQPRTEYVQPLWAGWPYVVTIAILGAFGFGFYLGKAP